MEQTQRILIYNALDTLEKRERSVLKLIYFKGFTEEEIAESYQITQQRVNQIKKRALEKCKIQLEEKPTFASIV